MMASVRWGLLSTARINKQLIPAISTSKRGDLVAVASRDHKTAVDYADKWNIPNAFCSYQDMLSSEIIDAVYISLPNHLHAEWSIKAMEAGVHVLCEKPFAISVDEVDQMIAASRQYKRVLAEAFMYRHHPQTKIAGEMIQSGQLGDICNIQGVFNFTITNPRNIRLIPQYGGGSLWDVGIYPVSFAQFIMGGLPERVSGFQWIGKAGVDETFAGILNYSDNRMAMISSSFRMPFHTSIEILGTDGRLILNRPFVAMDKNRQMIFHPREGKPKEIPVSTKELYLGEVEDMNNAILDGAPNYLTLDETRNHIRTVVALYESARSRKVVDLL
jgi:xylose dehydrogenase (NAD/NADP)